MPLFCFREILGKNRDKNRWFVERMSKKRGFSICVVLCIIENKIATFTVATKQKTL